VARHGSSNESQGRRDGEDQACSVGSRGGVSAIWFVGRQGRHRQRVRRPLPQSGSGTTQRVTSQEKEAGKGGRPAEAPAPPPEPIAVIPAGLPIEDAIAQLAAIQVDHPGAQICQESATAGRSGRQIPRRAKDANKAREWWPDFGLQYRRAQANAAH
jgi:hypothetical protein